MRFCAKAARAFVFCLLTFLFPFLSFSSASNYKRIVSLAPSATEILFAVGAGDQVVGVTTFCLRPEKAKSLPKVGGFTDHSMEAIVALKPDLVVMTPNRGTKFTHEKLKQIGIESLVLPLYSLEELDKSYRLVGEKTGQREGAELLRLTLEEAKAAVRPSRTESKAVTKVAFISWRVPFLVASGISLEGDILNWIGVENVADDMPSRYPRWDMEVLFEKDPDVIIDAGSHQRGDTLEEKKEETRKFWRKLSKLRAVREGRLYLLLDKALPVPGPRSVDFMNVLNEIIRTLPQNDTEHYAKIDL